MHLGMGESMETAGSPLGAGRKLSRTGQHRRDARCGARAGFLHTSSCFFPAAIAPFHSLRSFRPSSRFGPWFLQQQGHSKQEALLISSSSAEEPSLLPAKRHLWAPAPLNLSGLSCPGLQGSRAGRGGRSWGSLPPCQHPGHPARQGELTFPRLCRQGRAAASTPHRSPHPERAAGTWTREGPCTAMRKTGPAVGLRGRKGGSRDEAR